MTRLLQGRGSIYNSSLSKVRNNPEKQVVEMQDGEGFLSTISNLLKKGIEAKEKLAPIIKSAKDFSTGEVGTIIKNLAPSSDENARPAFVGENHSLLKLPNGKIGLANYMGPGTQIAKRIKRKDPPRTEADKVAQAHDLRYALGNSNADVRHADNMMVNKLKQIERVGGDSKINTQLGMRLIQAKILGEKSGVFKADQFASFGGIDKKDKALLKTKLGELEQEGFGLLPGDELKMKILKQMGKKKKMQKGTGKNIKITQKHINALVKITTSKFLPKLLEKIKKHGLPMQGSGFMNIQNKLNKLMAIRMNKVRGKGLKEIAKVSAKTLLPVICRMCQKGKGALGTINGKEISKSSKLDDLKVSLGSKLGSALFKMFKSFLSRGKKGNGVNLMKGEGFWDGFTKGFTETLKIGLPLLPLIL